MDSSLRLLILLDSLAKFASSLEEDTICGLIGEVPGTIAIKDSTASLGILRNLAERQIKPCRT